MEAVKRNTKAILNIFFVISGTTTTGVLSLGYSMIDIVINIMFSFLVLCILVYRFDIVITLLKYYNKKYLIVSIVFTFVSSLYLVHYIYEKSPHIYRQLIQFQVLNTNDYPLFLMLTAVLIWIVSLYIFFLCWNYFFNKYYPLIKKFILTLNILEKRFLIFSSVILICLIIVVYDYTNVFYTPMIEGSIIENEVIYTTDTGILLQSNIFTNIGSFQNDFKQPLFGLFALPLGTVAVILSKLVFFISNSYPIALAGMHIIVLACIAICISRLLNFKATEKLLFLLCYIVTYPCLLYLLNIEQYILSLFFLIVFIYLYIKKDTDHIDFSYLAATGSMLTSGILIMLLYKKNQIFSSVKRSFDNMIKFLILIIVCGKLPWFLHYSDIIASYGKFTGIDVTFTEKLYQYSNFVLSCFIKPNTVIDTQTFGYSSYQLSRVTDINILGVIIILISIIGFLWNYKNNYAKICFGWIIYSFIILCVFGWGTNENGLVLYTLYFSWAYISLVFMAISSIFRNIPIIKIILLSIMFIILLIVNAIGIWDLIQFGIQNYPIKT